MTHGPPKDIMDNCAPGHQGYENLLRAVRRARPRLHCFGHIHEGYGAEVVAWDQDSSEADRNGASTSTSAVTAGSHNPGAALVNQYPEPTDYAIA